MPEPSCKHCGAVHTCSRFSCALWSYKCAINPTNQREDTKPTSHCSQKKTRLSPFRPGELVSPIEDVWPTHVMPSV